MSWGALECDLFPPVEGLAEAAERLGRALGRIVEPLETLRKRLAARLEDDPQARERRRCLTSLLYSVYGFHIACNQKPSCRIERAAKTIGAATPGQGRPERAPMPRS